MYKPIPNSHPEPACAEPVSGVLPNSSRFGRGRFISGSKGNQLQKGFSALKRTSSEILKRVQDDDFDWEGK